jgi:hypothetical protein
MCRSRRYNSDLRWSFTTYKARSWGPNSVNEFELLMYVSDRIEPPEKVECLTAGYRPCPRIERSHFPPCELRGPSCEGSGVRSS